MPEQYLENFEIEIDRDALYKYLCVKYLGSWIAFLFVPAFLIGMLIIAEATENSEYKGIMDVIVITLTGFGIGLFVSGIVFIPSYFIFIHFMAGKVAKSLTVTVECAFLHIVQENYARVDRKLHFRAITDYSTVETRLMRYFGLKALRMTTNGVGLDSTVQLDGIKDCLKVRDMLAEIDSMRENG